MVQYDRKILNALLDSYENSLLFTGENKVKIRIAYPFTKKNLPAYFDESSLVHEEIHSSVKQLEQQGYVEILWKTKDIVQKVLLNEENLPQVYQYVKRAPKARSISQTLELLRELGTEYNTLVCGGFISYLKERIEEGQSVKEYIDLGDLRQTRRLIQAITWIETNQEACYIREFSLRHFGDSKTLEGILPLIGKAFRRFGHYFPDTDIYAVLAEYSIYHTPNYVYFKGAAGTLRFGKSSVDLVELRQGIGIAGEDLDGLYLENTETIRKVITIENLTTFFRWKEAESLIIYLGGYHNTSRRALLKMIHSYLPGAGYLHFGDIDAGGFEIFEDLKAKTQIPFQTYRMDLATLQQYEAYAKPLTENDRKHLRRLYDREGSEAYREVLEYMLVKGIKLEQECVEES